MLSDRQENHSPAGIRPLLALAAPLVITLTTALLTSCGSSSSVSQIGPTPALHEGSYVSFDGDSLPYRKWLPKSGVPELVVIGFHGISGASSDLKNLGEHLQETLPGAAVYAPDLRGQGNDPLVSRRGDIGQADEWFRDARTFSRLVHARHPDARIIWCGESMGSLIALHATAGAEAPPCEALILASPITAIRDDLPTWRRQALRVGAFLCPGCRISLEALSGQDEVNVIRDVVHQDQVQTNSYHLPDFTLRLLHTLGTLIEGMPEQASHVPIPVLVLHGGQDIFSRPEDVDSFVTHFPAAAHVQRRFYPESYHLLFYDHQHQEVLADIATWLRRLDRP